MLNYKAIEIFTSEGARCRNKPVADVVIDYIRNLKIAARCIVTRGIAGRDESGEVATRKLEILSYNLPIRIYIILPAAETDRVLADLNDLITEGIVALHGLQVIGHKARNAFFPRQLMVRDVMTPRPKSISTLSPLSDAARLLLSSIFTGLPVVNEKNRPVGIITQGDLIQKGGLPLRLGLLAETDPDHLESILKTLAARNAEAVMTTPAITIEEDRPLFDAVDLMLSKDVKRLPVVDRNGQLTGMLSRLDIFQTVMREAPDWNSFRAQNIEVKNLRTVTDILRRDTWTVSPESPIDEVIQVIDRNDIQRVAVVDADGRLLGLISDRDLLHYFKHQQKGIWGLFFKAKSAARENVCAGDLQQCLAATKAAAVMNTDLITVEEGMLIEDAIALMTRESLKRLPVVDGAGRFKGMISRDSLLRTGFGRGV